MRVIKSVDSLALHCYPQPDAVQKQRLYAGNGYFENNQFIYEAYNNDFEYGQFYVIEKQVYRRVDNLTGEKEKKLFDEVGKQPDLPCFFLDTITEKHVFPSKIIDNKFTVSLRNYPEKRDKSIVLFDLVSKKSKSLPSYSLFNRIVNNAIYSMEDRDRTLLKRDFNLNTTWQYNIDSPASSLRLWYAFINDGIFITFIGPEEEKTQVVNGIPEEGFSGGQLIGFNDDDGSVAWQLEIPNAVDAIKQMGQQLIIASLTEILIVDSQTGSLLQSIATGTNKPFYRVLAIGLHVDDNYIYYTNTADSCLCIYSRTDYQLIKKLIAPEGYSVRHYMLTDKSTGKHYFNVNNISQYVAQSALLEIDPNNLTDEITLESEPEHIIELVPSADNANELELEIKLHSASLDDALRFGEIYTRDHCQWHSHSAVGISFIGREANPNFNGIVRFIYSGCKKPADVVNEHLTIMEKRFDRWNDGEGFYAQPSTRNKNELTRLIAQYVND